MGISQKTQNISKTPLTSSEAYAIILKLPDARRRGNRKSFLRKEKLEVDKSEAIW
jgi:hypothetical protein